MLVGTHVKYKDKIYIISFVEYLSGEDDKNIHLCEIDKYSPDVLSILEHEVKVSSDEIEYVNLKDYPEYLL